MALLLLLHSREAHASSRFRTTSMHKLNGTKSILRALPTGHLLRRVKKTAGVSSSVGPRSAGHRLPLVVHVDRVHPLVEKAEQAADRRTGGQRVGVAPHDVFEHPIADRRGPIRCPALVRTMGGGLGRLQELSTNVLLRQVIADRQTSFEQQPGVSAVRYGHASEHD